MSLESQITKLNKNLEETNSKLDALLQSNVQQAPVVVTSEGQTGGVNVGQVNAGKPESSSEKETTESTPAAPDAEKDSTEATDSAHKDADASTGAELKEVMRGKLIAVREQEGDNSKAIAVMKEFGAASIGKVKESDYQNIINACEEILL